MNQAFIDGQNLNLGTTQAHPNWYVDFKKFRIYLKDKYNVDQAYYFMGWINNDFSDIYDMIQEAGFILSFREHSPKMSSVKKGNVDTDIVFAIMRKLYKNEIGKVVLVSGDGDYIRVVKFLISENRLEKVLMPNRKFASSLYKSLPTKHYDFLNNPDIKSKIEFKGHRRKKKAESP